MEREDRHVSRIEHDQVRFAVAGEIAGHFGASIGGDHLEVGRECARPVVQREREGAQVRVDVVAVAIQIEIGHFNFAVWVGRVLVESGWPQGAAGVAPFRLGEVGIFQLINAFQNVLKRFDPKEDLREMFGEHFAVSDKIELILERVSARVAIRFSELFAQAASRVEIVVTFLALLELIRLKQVRAVQSDVLDEIKILPVAL